MRIRDMGLAFLFCTISNPALAACSLADLAGSWTFLGTDGEDVCTATIPTSGKFKATCTSMETKKSYTVSIAASLPTTCKLGGSITIGGSTFPIAGRAEQVTGTLKPNTLMLRVVRSDVTWNSAMIAYRN